MKLKLNYNSLVNSVVLLGIIGFLLSYFKPELLLSNTITTGGDTASHYYSAYFMREELLPHGKIVGWTQGNYAGFPLFQFYFFLPFLLMALMSYIIPLQVSFKLISVLGTFLLPFAAYFSMKKMRFEFPVPIISAVFMLPFLFMEANSMWGGNIPSTLAGEFSYSISLALSVLFLGMLYHEINNEEKHYLPLVALLLLITFTHVYTLLWVVIASVFFLFDRNRFFEKVGFLFKVFLISFLLSSFWTVPMILKLSYTTPFAVVWHINGLKEVFPRTLLPFYLLSLIGLIVSLIKKRTEIFYLLFSLLTAYVLFRFATVLEIVDIRFIPFIQLIPLLVAAYGAGEIFKGFKGKEALPFIALIATVLWVNSTVTFIPNWIEWNYDGFENKPLWNSYNSVNNYLNGGPGSPRVVYEHSPLHNSAGSTRAFESLPLFSGRNTLEGLYMQSTISAPFVFYIQSEISKVTSCPFPQWPCTRLNTTLAAAHLKMFNVQHIISRTEETKEALAEDENYELLEIINPFYVYELKHNKGNYVEIPKYEPIAFETEQWKEVSFLWFINPDNIDVPLVYMQNSDDISKFSEIRHGFDLENLPKKTLDSDCEIEEEMSHSEIKFRTACPGAPHLIKISYFPNWKVEGAKKIFLASPSFMLVYPENNDVRIYFGRTLIDFFGLFLTIIGLGIVILEKKTTRLLTFLSAVNFDKKNKIFKHYSRYFIILFFLAVFGLSIIWHGHSLEKSYNADMFGKRLAVATKKYTLCDARINSQDIKDECFKEVGVLTNDSNLCDVRIESPIIRDECLSEIAINTDDLNLCLSKVHSEEFKNDCKKKISN